jgi:hypothetical protein
MLAAIFVAKLLSLGTVVLGVLTGVMSRAWRHVAVASVLVVGVEELLLTAFQRSRTFDVGVFAIGILAAAAWVSLAFGIKKSGWLSNRSEKQ